MEDIKRILVVSRMTMESKKAIHYGASLARKYSAELYVIQVVHNPFGLEGWNLPVPSVEEEYRNILKQTKAELDGIIMEESRKGAGIKELIKEGDPTSEILNAVKEHNIDLMIMVGHEEGRLEHFLFGHSNEQIIRKMPCSILILKQEPGPVGFY
ncbi:MAG: universal stress protein [Nitrospiraceae bacterium]|nr:universal stress protein [Nitrospiraceae bacterium]